MEDAEDWYRRALQLDDNAQVRVHYGLFLLDRHRYGEAVHQLRAAVRRQPAVYDYVFNLAVAARLAGQLELAEQSYRQAVGLRPGVAEPHLNLGAVLHLRGALVEAEGEYLTAWRLNPGEETTRINIERLHNVMRKRNITTKQIDL